ncbi:MAG: alpha-D-glucose phosphate-specific phosphoglucomutase [Dissulfuribacterales bacterium]
MIRTIQTTPFDDQKPGTSGLRKKTRVFMQPNYLENFVQAILFELKETNGTSLVIGGDGRYYNRQAIQTIIKMAAANGIKHIYVAQNGLLSTPAASHFIRKYGISGGIILSASHNPGGIDEDFGVKFNTANGGPASESVTNSIYETSRNITHYLIADIPDIDMDSMGTAQVLQSTIHVFDGIDDYVQLMETLFDLERIKELLKTGFSLRLDAMNAATGPYLRAIFRDRLNMDEDTLLRCIPLEDFGGIHPDPNLKYAAGLVQELMRPDGPDFAAAFDGDGDRNMILGRGIFVTPSDSLAILAANAPSAPGYAAGICGIARSMPTSQAADRVAEKLNIPCFETPTGWKFFGNLLDAGLATICGEESFGTGSNHVREKDGIWAALLWLNILAVKGKSVQKIMHEHWQRFGRNYYSRHDYEAIDSKIAQDFMHEAEEILPSLKNKHLCGLTVKKAENFSYKDPVDGSLTQKQGICVAFEDGSRIVFRLSGTGTQGATLRVYLERYETPQGNLTRDTQEALKDLILWNETVFNTKQKIKKNAPDVIT